MKKYRVAALPKMQEGGNKPKKKKSKYDIEGLGFIHQDVWGEHYDAYSDSLEDGEVPTEKGFVHYFQDIASLEESPLYLVPRTNKDGTMSFEAYDANILANKIFDQGIRPQQMSEKMNLGNIEDLERTFKPVIDFSKEVYMDANKATMDNLISTGMSVEEAVNDLYEKNMGTKEGLTNLFYDEGVKSQNELLERYKKYLTQDVDENDEVIGDKKDYLKKYEGLIEPSKVGKKIIKVDKNGNQIYSPENLRKERLQHTEEWNKQLYDAEQWEQEKRRNNFVASTLSMENAPGAEALRRDQYNSLRGLNSINSLEPSNSSVSYEDWLSGINIGTNKYTQESIDEMKEDMAPNQKTKPKLSDYVGNAGAFGDLTGTPPVVMTSAQKDGYKAYKEALKQWKDTPGFVDKYVNDLSSTMLAKELGLDDIENMSEEQKMKVLKKFNEEVNEPIGVLKNVYDKDTKTWSFDRTGRGLTNEAKKVSNQISKKLDPLNYFDYSTREDDQPNFFGQLFNLATGTNTFSNSPPIVKKSLDFDPATGKSILKEGEKISKLSDREINSLYHKGTGVFQDFNLPTKDLIGFDINLAPTGIGSVGLQGVNALVKAGQAGAKFRGIPGFKGFTGKNLRRAWNQPLTKTLGVDAAAKAVGIKTPQLLKNINKGLTPSNALYAHYLHSAPEYVKTAITEELPSAYKNLKEGNYKDAAADAALGAWGLSSVMPFVRGANTLRNFRGTKGTLDAPFLKDYTIGIRGKNTGMHFNPQKNKDIKSLFSVGDPTGRFRFEVGKYRPKFGEGMNQNLQLQKEGGITQAKSKIKGAGDGMFTTRGFKKGDVIGLAHRDDQPASKLGKMHNHNEEAPTMFSKKIGNERYVFANRDLEPGEELTTNYRMQPELEQPEDFQKGGAKRVREIPIAQGGGPLKTLKEIKNELPQVFREIHEVLPMNARDYSKYKDLTNLISTYAYSGIPQSKEIFDQNQLDKFKSIQRDRARKALSKALNNEAVTKEDLVSILTQSEDGSALARGMGTGRLQNKTFFKATPKDIGELSPHTNKKFNEEEDPEYIRKISESLMNLSKDQLKEAVLQTESNITVYRQQVSNLVQQGMSPEEAIDHVFRNKSPEVVRALKENPNYALSSVIEKPIFTPLQVSIDKYMEHMGNRDLFESAWREPYHEGFRASDLRPGEQLLGNFSQLNGLMQNVKVKEGLGLLTQQGMPEETLALYARRLNEAFHREKANSIITGSLDTSADSYPMQTKRVLRATSPRRAAKLGVSETPQFLGYHTMNHMGFFDKFISQPALNIPNNEKRILQASLLQKELSDIYDQAKIPLDQRLPIMSIPRGGMETVSYKGRDFYGGDILLPQFGVLKKEVQWPEGHKRMLLQDGGTPGVSPPPDSYPEGFSHDPRAFRGQVPGKAIRQQRKANKKLMEPGMGVYGVDLEREKGVPPYNFDKQSREQNRKIRQNKRQTKRDERPPRTGTSHPINQSNKYTWWSKHIGQHFKGRTGKQRYSPGIFQGRRIKTMQQGGFIESKLNQKEIDNLVKQGYIIEEM